MSLLRVLIQDSCLVLPGVLKSLNENQKQMLQLCICKYCLSDFIVKSLDVDLAEKPGPQAY